MRIKRLKVAGFKSFVEPAELRIEPGLTGVVGPNGCGKSNILEAIRWVMGESSPKSMRGAGMDDVIFAGTATRPSRDFAEVSLLIERDGEAVPGDLGLTGATELEVTRRIERSAGSAYRVNGRDVRAKDVGLLFADAATGAHSPALVSQGKIAQVIAARPTERRQMLEEAAGISGLHVRRRDAETKLRAAEANLVRLDEMLADLESRAAALKRQARAAERYRKLSDDIRTAEARLLFVRWREAAAAADAARTEAAATVAATEQAAQGQRAAAPPHTPAAAQAEAAAALTAARAEAQAAREAATSLGHRLATITAERDTVARRIRELAGKQSTLAADWVREAALAEDATAVLARLDAERAAIAARLTDAEASRATIDLRTIAAEDAARAAEAALGGVRVRQAAEQAEARVAHNALDLARSKLARAEAEARRLKSQLGEIGDAGPLIETQQAAQAARAAAETKLAEAGQALRDAEAARTEAAGERDRAESEGASARATLAALQSEAQALLKAIATGDACDKALHHVRAAPGYEQALAAALGDDLDAALGGETGRRWTGAEAQASDPDLPAGIAPLAAHVTAPPALARRLAQIGVAEQDDGHQLVAGQRLVTRDGRLRRWDGFVATGIGAAAAERLTRINRLAAIESDLPQAAAVVDAAAARVKAAQAGLRTAAAAGDAARRAEAEEGAAIRAATRTQDEAAVALERLELRRAGLADRLQLAEADRADAEGGVQEAMTAVAALPDARSTAELAAAFGSDAERAGRALADIRAEAATHARAMGADRQRAAAAAKESADWTVRGAEAAKRHAELGRRIAEAETEAERLADAPARIATELARFEADAAGATKDAETRLAAERAAEASLRAADAALAECAEALATAREARAGAAARAEHAESRRVELTRISGERFECPPPLLPRKAGFEETIVQPIQAESAALERLTADRERIGPVNLVATRELAELEEGRANSVAEREELGVAIHRLRGSIGSLNREGRARLLAAFEAVDRHFRTLFTTLFEGGQAHLELVESDDPLEAGLEILAQPPGKRLSTLTLLSGGEQALTAIALIFALFLTNPAPICVLDEVDAPLDDANIERFCDLLDRMTADTDTRYLIVTHNAVTMSRMHRLFGVTMVERGVSRLVSVDLSGAERLLAAE